MLDRNARVKERRRATYQGAAAKEWMDGVGFLLLVGATILTASISSVVVGLLTWSIVAFALSLVGGVILGEAWYQVAGRLGAARWPDRSQAVAYFGGPIAAVLVAVAVATGSPYVVAGVVAMTLVSALWLIRSLWPRTAHRRGDPTAPLDRAQRLARLKALHAEGRLTTEEYAAITADLLVRGGSPPR